MIIISVEETALLPAVDEVVGGVEIEEHVLRRRGVGGEELIDQDFGDADQGLAIDAVLQAAEGRGRGEGPILVGPLPGGHLEGGVGAEGLMVVEVLVSQGQGQDPLSEQGLLVVDDEDGMAGVGDGSIQGIEEAEAVGDLAEE
jgi:hypothetical protein